MINVVDRVPTYPNRIKVTKSDGTSEYVTWERADEPTVPGTPINKALFDSIVEDIGLNKTTTVYVSTAGSDALGDGSAANPYATITKALNSFSKNLNGFGAIINVTSGRYEEDVNISGFFGGNVIFTGVAGSSVSVRSLRISYGSSVNIQDIGVFEVTGSYSENAISIANASLVCTTSMRITSATEYGVYISRGGLLVVTNNFEVTNTINAAVQALHQSRVSLNTISGALTSGVFIRSINGANVSYSVMNGSAPIAFSTSVGGRIYSNAQTSMPNY